MADLSDIFLGAGALVVAFILVMVLAIQVQVRSIGKKVDTILEKMS